MSRVRTIAVVPVLLTLALGCDPEAEGEAYETSATTSLVEVAEDEDEDQAQRASPDEPVYACACEDGNTATLGCCGGNGERACVSGVPTSSCASSCLPEHNYNAGSARCEWYGVCGGGALLGRDDGLCYAHGPCGAPGRRACINTPSCESGSWFDPSTSMCELQGDADAPCVSPAYVPAAGPYTLIVATDLHAGATKIEEVRAHAAKINKTHSAYLGRPKSVAAGDPTWKNGELIGNPLQVVTTGDLTHYGHGHELGILRSFYEPESHNALPDTVRLPVYPGLGNHDLVTEGNNSSYAQRMLRYIENRVSYSQRSNSTCQAASAYDAASRSYAWRVGEYHLIQLHDAARGATSVKGSSLDWLKSYLASAVGSSGRPVVLFQHFGVDQFSMQQRWWRASDRAALRDALAGYNVRAIFAGHAHDPAHYRWEGIDVYQGSDGGQDADGGVIAVRLAGGAVEATMLEWDGLGDTLHARHERFDVARTVHSGRQLMGTDVALCVDLPGSSQEEGAGMIGYPCHGQDNQRFNLVADGAGPYFQIGVEINAQDGANRCLDVPGGSTADGAQVIQWGCNYGSNQSFELVDVNASQGTYRVKARHSSKCLTLPTQSGGAVTQQPCGQARQVFKLTP